MFFTAPGDALQGTTAKIRLPSGMLTVPLGTPSRLQNPDKPKDDAPRPEGDPQKTPEQPPKRKLKNSEGREIELTDAELEQLAWAGVDYTRKTQALQRQFDDLKAFQNIGHASRANPDYARHVLTYGQQAQGQPQAQKPVAQPPEDPIERLKWEIRQDVLQETEKLLAPVKEGQQAVSKDVQEQMLLTTLKSQDPLFEQVYNTGLPLYFKNLPEGMAKREIDRLNHDPDGFLEVYQHVRRHVEQAIKDQPQTQGKPGGENVQPTQQRPPVVPLAEAPGVTKAVFQGMPHQSGAPVLRAERGFRPDVDHVADGPGSAGMAL